ncbi:OsmC family protein [Rhodococcoides corynebacterioides]|uniref:OsmC family protein n=1 Tax=Rhodococcoides corynebacterioides TaxID=53972 RepID=UPI001C9AE296|nr:OsmC family protein [Rhodococcus corynebacterioides]MBY6362100.1 OsmC family protein [Rhodococcus corynebacterioides]
MTDTRHTYSVSVTWTGNSGAGTASLRSYSRDHEIEAPGVPTIAGSSDPAFRGDASRWNPEQLFVASIAQCHMLWYLGLAAQAGVIVTSYVDAPIAVMIEEPGGAGQFESVTLRPVVRIDASSDADLAEQVHHRVADYCVIARSITTPIGYEVTIER